MRVGLLSPCTKSTWISPCCPLARKPQPQCANILEAKVPQRYIIAWTAPFHILKALSDDCSNPRSPVWWLPMWLALIRRKAEGKAQEGFQRRCKRSQWTSQHGKWRWGDPWNTLPVAYRELCTLDFILGEGIINLWKEYHCYVQGFFKSLKRSLWCR